MVGWLRRLFGWLVVIHFQTKSEEKKLVTQGRVGCGGFVLDRLRRLCGGLVGEAMCWVGVGELDNKANSVQLQLPTGTELGNKSLNSQRSPFH